MISSCAGAVFRTVHSHGHIAGKTIVRKGDRADPNYVPAYVGLGRLISKL